MPPEPSTVMCAWCGRHISGPKTSDQDRVSHGICGDCKRKQVEEVEKLRKAASLKPGQKG